MSRGSPTLLQPGRMIVTPRETMSIDPESPESARPGGSRPPTEPETPWRRGRDSNPRFRFPGTRAFQARPFNHSGTSPTNQDRDARRRGMPPTRAAPPGGEGGIRTRDTRTGIPVFETGAFNHSATSPGPKLYQRPIRAYSWDERLRWRPIRPIPSALRVDTFGTPYIALSC